MDHSQDANGTTDDNDPSRSRTTSGQAARRVVEIRLMSDDESHQELSAERSPYFQTHEPLATYASNRETVLHREQDASTLEETHVIRNEGIQDMYFTEEHWSSEIKSFVTTTPPKFVQVIKAYRVLSTDRLTLVVEVSSDPPAIFEWSANDRLVAQDPRRFVVRHGVNVTTLSVEGPEQG
ncbi:Immunoglobulin I-set domain containing protein, partial [Aphelenchoides avenae]